MTVCKSFLFARVSKHSVMSDQFVSVCMTCFNRFDRCVIAIDGDNITRKDGIDLSDGSNTVIRVYKNNQYVYQKPWLVVTSRETNLDFMINETENWIILGVSTLANADEEKIDGSQCMEIIVKDNENYVDAFCIPLMELQNGKIEWLNNEIKRLQDSFTSDKDTTDENLGERLRAVLEKSCTNDTIQESVEPTGVKLVPLTSAGVSLVTFGGSGYFKKSDVVLTQLKAYPGTSIVPNDVAIMALCSRVEYIVLLQNIASGLVWSTAKALVQLLDEHVVSYMPNVFIQKFDAHGANNGVLFLASRPFYLGPFSLYQMAKECRDMDSSKCLKCEANCLLKRMIKRDDLFYLMVNFKRKKVNLLEAPFEVPENSIAIRSDIKAAILNKDSVLYISSDYNVTKRRTYITTALRYLGWR